jgi:uncharacterized coiled-coil protein SlyX
MQPDPRSQIRWGLGACVVTVLIVSLLAFVPDPFFRYRTVSTTLDDVEGIQPGTKVLFRGATVGDVKAIELNSAARTFAVSLSILKAWHPSACSYVTIAAANPFTAPAINLVALEGPSTASPAQCSQARAAADCLPVDPVPNDSAAVLIGCRRSPDLIQSATLAVNEAVNVVRTADEMAQRLQTMIQGSGQGKPVDMAQVANNATATLAALHTLSTRLDRSFTPGKGDIALTLANVRKMSGRAAQIDVVSANGVLRETQAMIAKNQASIASLLAEGSNSATLAHTTLEGASASLVQASVNLERASASLDTLSERLAADPTYAIRGQKYADPPAPGATK